METGQRALLPVGSEKTPRNAVLTLIASALGRSPHSGSC